MRDTLSEAMDIDGLEELSRGIANGSIQCLAVDTPVPSQFAHELLNALPYAYLDEADLEAAQRVDGNANRLYLDPLFRGSYPEDMLGRYASMSDFAFVRDGDLEKI